jgi:hypothetical protein
MYKHIRAEVYTDTMFNRVKSLRQNTCAQVYVTRFHWTKVYPMKTKSEAHLTLDMLHQDVGIFHTIIPDNAPELAAGEFRKKAIRAGSRIKPIEAYTHNQNMAESAIRELRRMYRKAMTSTNAPHILWDYCLTLMATIRSHTALDIKELDGDSPVARLTGDTPDISHLCEFRWYDLVWYVDPVDKLQNKKLGRYLGPSHDVGQAMCSKLLTSKGREISRTSVVPISIEDKNNEVCKKQLQQFDEDLRKALGDRMEGIPVQDNDDSPVHEPYWDDTMTESQDSYSPPDDFDLDELNKYINARVLIPHGGQIVSGRVLKRKRDEDGNLIGKSNEDPLLDSSIYKVQLDDGRIESYSANLVAENMYEQVDSEGSISRLMGEIVEHRRLGDAVHADDNMNVKGHPRQTTKGWQLCVRWRDGSTSWERLALLKMVTRCRQQNTPLLISWYPSRPSTGVYTICGPEFGPENIGKAAIIEKALYGLRTSAFAWREHLATTLVEALGFQHCLADNDVWMRPATKANGEHYYQLVLIHTDDLLVIAESPRDILNMLDQHYVLKPGSIGIPKTYLGAEVGQYSLPDQPDKPRWFMGSEKYVKEAVKNVRDWLNERNRILKTKAPSVIPSGYRPELDMSDYCNRDEGNYYQQQVGVLRWMVELGRIDIAVEVSMLASYTVAPRQGHFDALMHIFAYLQSHARSKLVFDDSYVDIQDVPPQDWGAFYPDAKEQIPDNCPPARGRAMQMTVFADADHAGDRISRRSRAGIILYLNRSPIVWYTKKQNSVETSTFGSEFMAVKAAVELIKGMRYKLRMLGIPLEGPTTLFVNNMSVVANTSAPESTLKKKSNAIAYHYVRESVAARIIQIEFIRSADNKADILTKPQTGPERQRLVSGILY